MQNQFVDLYRHGIKTAAEITRASLESFVQLQERQLSTVRTLLDETRRNVESVAEAKSFEDLVAVQSRVAGNQLERMAEFWSSSMHAVADQQKAWIERVQSQIGQTKDRIRETYDLTARTSEEIARTAANQVSRATGSVREAASATQEQQRRKSA